MEAFYFEIRAVHILAVIASGSLLMVRAAVLNLFGAAWPMAAPVRFLAYTIDTVLLTAALMLMTIVRQYPFADAWLTAKVLLLLVYIICGYFALRGRGPRHRLAGMAGAALVYAFIFSIARAHDALGFFA